MSSTTFLLELVVNWLWSCLLVAPLVVTYWRGTWDLLEDLVNIVLSKNIIHHFTVGLPSSVSGVSSSITEPTLWPSLLPIGSHD